MRAGLAPAALLALAASSPAAQAPRPPVFSSDVGLVEVPVVVTDRDGRPVPDLAADDFEVRERDVPQAIAAFERVWLPAPIADGGSPVPAAPLDVATNERAGQGRLYVLLLDAWHVSPTSVLAVRRHARRFVAQHVGPDDLVAVVSPGALAEATQGYTTDKARLVAAIDHFNGSVLRSATMEIESERRATFGDTELLHQGKDPADAERAARAQSLSSVLQRLAGQLVRVPRRRKALLLFSEGVDYNVADVMGRVQEHATAVSQDAERAARALLRADVSVYAIDPRGLAFPGDSMEALPAREAPGAPDPFGPPQLMDFSTPSLESERENALDSLRHVADTTGGFAVVERADVDRTFDRIVRENSTYYVIGYAQPAGKKAKGFVPIRVRVRRPGLRVVARRGYVAGESGPAEIDRDSSSAAAYADGILEAEEAAFAFGERVRRPRAVPLSAARPASAAPRGVGSALAALLSSPLPVPGLPFRVQATVFRGEGRRNPTQVLVEVAGASLPFAEKGDRRESKLEIASFTIDSSGNVGNGRSTTIDMRLTAEEYRRAKATSIRWISPLDLAPGRYVLRVAARAPATGVAGVVSADVDVPRFDTLPALSGLSLTSLPSALAVTRGNARLAATLVTPPTAERRFVLGDRLQLAAEGYVPAATTTTTIVTFEVERDGAGVVLRRQETPPMLEGRPDVRDVSVPIDTGSFRPGPHVLRVRLEAAGRRTERSVPFELVAPSR
ncbi:MAG: VWA domain-containing protein [Vicinamibacteria bacterium]